MCIVLISTAHPDYQLILINNRDEYLNRPTAPAQFWPAPYAHVLGGRDLLRPAQGTWLGVTLDGRVACLTNYREENTSDAHGRISRGEMVNAFLRPSTNDLSSVSKLADELISGEGARGSGGFSLLCGRIGEGRFAVVGNRMERPVWIESGKTTVGLSNAVFGDRSWPKVVDGEERLKAAITESMEKKEGKEELVRRLLELLSVDTLPPRKEGESWRGHVKELRKSIFIPVVGDSEHRKPGEQQRRSSVADEKLGRVKSLTKEELGVSGAYGTQKQTIVLVDRENSLTYLEKTLLDEHADVVDASEAIRQFEFKIQSG